MKVSFHLGHPFWEEEINVGHELWKYHLFLLLRVSLILFFFAHRGRLLLRSFSAGIQSDPKKGSSQRANAYLPSCLQLPGILQPMFEVLCLSKAALTRVRL